MDTQSSGSQDCKSEPFPVSRAQPHIRVQSRGHPIPAADLTYGEEMAFGDI